MFARVSLFNEPVDAAIRVTREQVVPVVLGFPGSQGGFFLVDREGGRTLSITLWENQEALDGSAAAIAQLRTERPQHVPGSELVHLGEYEVVLAPPSVDRPAS